VSAAEKKRDGWTDEHAQYRGCVRPDSLGPHVMGPLGSAAIEQY
jgi:hypothetical protein